MKKILLFALLVAPVLSAGENLFKNSTMDSSSGWSGDRKFEAIDANRVLTVTAHKNKVLAFSQSVTTRDLKDLVLKFRYKTSDYAGRGLMIRGERVNGGFTYITRDLNADGGWHEITWVYTAVRGNNKINFVFEVMDGSGSVSFDDITLENKEVATSASQ